MQNKYLILIQLNEINFDLVMKYTEKYKLNNLKKLLSSKSENYRTTSEKTYNLLEPWIVNYRQDLVFRELEKLKLKVGAIAPMNAKNDIENPEYFIPDPWTNTSSDKSKWSIKITN